MSNLHIMEITTIEGETQSVVIRSSTHVVDSGVLVYLDKDNNMKTYNVKGKIKTITTNKNGNLHTIEIATVEGETQSVVIRSSTHVVGSGVIVYLDKENNMKTFSEGKIRTVITKPHSPKKRGNPADKEETKPKMKTIDHNGYGKSTGKEEYIPKFAPTNHK